MPEPIELEICDLGNRRVAAMQYIAYLCYPNDNASWQKFVAAVAALFLKFLRDEENTYVPGAGVVLRKEVPKRTCRRRLIKAEKILIAKRFPIARDVAGQVAAIRLGYPGEGPRSLSVAIDEYVKATGRDADNIRQREWYATRPVAHLALGMLVAIDGDRFDNLSLMELMMGPDPTWIEEAIQFSNTFLERLSSAGVIKDEHLPIVIHVKKLL